MTDPKDISILDGLTEDEREMVRQTMKNASTKEASMIVYGNPDDGAEVLTRRRVVEVIKSQLAKTELPFQIIHKMNEALEATKTIVYEGVIQEVPDWSTRIKAATKMGEWLGFEEQGDAEMDVSGYKIEDLEDRLKGADTPVLDWILKHKRFPTEEDLEEGFE